MKTAERWPGILAAILCAVILGACAPRIEFAPPPQKAVPSGPERPLVHPFIEMSDLRADGFIIRDVAAPDDAVPREYRWTNRRPAFRVWLDDAKGRIFRMRLAVPEETFAVTGPVTVSVLVNGQHIAAPRFAQPKLHDFSCPVAEALLANHSPAIVGLDIAPAFIEPHRHEELGVLLYSIGLPRAQEP